MFFDPSGKSSVGLSVINKAAVKAVNFVCHTSGLKCGELVLLSGEACAQHNFCSFLICRLRQFYVKIMFYNVGPLF